jgi:hypothetical protein
MLRSSACGRTQLLRTKDLKQTCGRWQQVLFNWDGLAAVLNFCAQNQQHSNIYSRWQ